jgi:hypothetical protein
MRDEKTETGRPENLLVNIHDRHEVEYWTKKWNVTCARLVDAVNAVGPKAHLVARRLESFHGRVYDLQRR